MPTKCSVFHCNNPSFSKDLCQKHYKRQLRHGSIEQTRPDDWGAREKHPAYKAWCGLRRYHRLDMEPTWVDDFWAFAHSIPKKPSDEARAFRIDKARPWSVDNFYWKESKVSSEYKQDRAEYMRRWMSKARVVNKDYFKSADLKKLYGITIEWYKAQHDVQNGLCAICSKPETAKIRGNTLSLAVDHCHDTGDVRELLCRACNNAIGALNHSPATLRKAADYLERHTSAPGKNRA
jgi:hypothetical protein